MGLMFQRLAHNYAKNGYFPTDASTIEGVLNLLIADTSPDVTRIFDPTAGEGSALAEVQHHLRDLGANVESYGIEYDQERAIAAREVLSMSIHADLSDVVLGARQFGLLWLNPPYGLTVADKAQTGDRSENRLEKLFYRRAINSLAYGGVLVLIVPHYSVDAEFATWLLRGFKTLRVYRAGTDRFKQVVIVGTRTKSDNTGVKDQRALFADVRNGTELLPNLPVMPVSDPYHVPTTNAVPRLEKQLLDAEQLTIESRRFGGLWPSAVTYFAAGALPPRVPLCKPTRWHQALMLASGAISGLVTSDDGEKTFLIKGQTRKEQSVRQSSEMDDEGNRFDISVSTDYFCPSITAIDMTPGITLGQLVLIGA